MSLLEESLEEEHAFEVEAEPEVAAEERPECLRVRAVVEFLELQCDLFVLDLGLEFLLVFVEKSPAFDLVLGDPGSEETLKVAVIARESDVVLELVLAEGVGPDLVPGEVGELAAVDEVQKRVARRE